MKIKIEKKNEEKYLVYFSDNEALVQGIFLSKTELKKLKANLDQMLEYDVSTIGDEI